MGSFFTIDPSGPGEDIQAKYNIPVRAEHMRRQCEHTGEDGVRCEYNTMLRPDRDGSSQCFFHHADSSAIAGTDPVFDEIMRRIASQDLYHEEECSIYYYHDNYTHIKNHRHEIDTIIEVGCYLGGMSAVFAQIAEAFDLTLCIVEYNLQYLMFTYERIARVCPEALKRTHFYFGVFPEFAAENAENLRRRSVFLEIDGAHTYEGVLNDLQASYDVRRGIHSIACHDFHLRSADWKHDLFVDRAIYAVFGVGATLRGMGFNTGDWIGNPDDEHSGNQLYNKPDCFEGATILLAENSYCFERLPERPPLRHIFSSFSKKVSDWIRRKITDRWKPGAAPPLDEESNATGIEFIFPIECDKQRPEHIAVKQGKSCDLAMLSRVFKVYGEGRAHRQIEKGASISIESSDPGIVRCEGTMAYGEKTGKAEICVRAAGFERKIDMLVE